MRAASISAILAVSVVLVWLESAIAAVWSPMDFVDASRAGSPRRVPETWPQHAPRVMITAAPGLDGVWYSAHGPEPDDDSLNPTLYRLVSVRTGWPIRTFRYERTLEFPNARGTIGWHMDTPDSNWAGGIAIQQWMPRPEESASNEGSIRRIPLRPIWLGLCVATAAHALLMAGLLAAPSFIRRHLRAAGGRCPVCGYDKRGLSQCPECGNTQVSQSLRTPAL